MKILYFSGWLTTRLITRVVFRIRVSGTEHVPAEGGFILACNHRSFYDPPIVGSWIRRPLYFFAKRELFSVPLLGWLISRTNALPVRRGAVDREALRRAVEVIRRGYGLTVFPEGTRSRTGEFLPPKAGVGMIARAAGCPIVPAYLHGTDRLRDCLVGRDRLELTYGEPVPGEWIESQPPTREGHEAIAHEVMRRIRALAEQRGRELSGKKTGWV